MLKFANFYVEQINFPSLSLGSLLDLLNQKQHFTNSVTR